MQTLTCIGAKSVPYPEGHKLKRALLQMHTFIIYIGNQHMSGINQIDWIASFPYLFIFFTGGNDINSNDRGSFFAHVHSCPIVNFSSFQSWYLSIAIIRCENTTIKIHKKMKEILFAFYMSKKRRILKTINSKCLL